MISTIDGSLRDQAVGGQQAPLRMAKMRSFGNLRRFFDSRQAAELYASSSETPASP
jgi:hypothetical protein